MATTVKVYGAGEATDGYVRIWVKLSGDRVDSSTTSRLYSRMDGSMDAVLVNTVSLGQISGQYYSWYPGIGHYGQVGVDIVGVTNGIVWSDVMWSSFPSQRDLRVVRTGDTTAELRGTNYVDYVEPEQYHWVSYDLRVGGGYGESYDDLPIAFNLAFSDGYVNVGFSRDCWSCSEYPDFIGAGATYSQDAPPTNVRVPQSLSVPLAPTITSSPSAIMGVGSSSSVSWSPNHPDYTDQGAAQVKIDSSTYNVSGSVTTYKIPSSVMGSVGSHTISVRTQNALNQSWGAWSTPITFQVSKLPSLTVTSPARNYVLSELPLSVSWDASDATGISQQTVEILNSLGSTLWQTSVDVGTMGVDVGRDQYYLESGQAYSVRVTVTNGVNLSSSVTVPFTVLYVGPANPEVTVSQGTGCSMSVSVDFVESSGKPDVDTADVYRIDQFGGQTLLGTVSDSGGSVLDALPPLNVDFSYRIVVFAASGASTAITTEARVDSGGMEAWNFGPSASTALLLGLNASGSRSTQFSGETFHFALGPSTPALPTFYPDGDLDATGSHSYVVHGVEDYLRVRSVVEDPNSAVCWFRDAFGGRHTVHASWQTGYDASSYDLFTVTASATEVVWEEPTI